jgi:hypothetical protein
MLLVRRNHHSLPMIWEIVLAHGDRSCDTADVGRRVKMADHGGKLCVTVAGETVTNVEIR